MSVSVKQCILPSPSLAPPTSTMSDGEDDIFAGMDPAQLAEYRKYFDMFDKAKKGFIMASQAGQACKAIGLEFDDKNLKELLREFDTDGSGQIEFEEFVLMVNKLVEDSENSAALEGELREAFRLYDKQNQGFIPTSALRDLLAAVDEKLTDEELDEMIAEIDQDGSGTVDFEEFKEMMSG